MGASTAWLPTPSSFPSPSLCEPRLSRRETQEGSMGSSSSRQGSRTPKHPRPKRSLKRTLSSIFICGSSSTLPNDMEDDSTEDCHDQGNPTKFQRPRKEFSLPSGTEHSSTSPKSNNQAFLESSVVVNENRSPENGDGTVVDCRSGYRASTSNQDRVLPHPNSSKGRVDMSFIDGSDDMVERITQSDRSSQVFEDLLAVENEIPEREVVLAHNSSFESIDDTCQETIPSILGLSVPEREQEQRDETVQHDDVTSVSSDNLSSLTTEINTRELRLDTRRLLWDAFLRDNGGRRSDSQSDDSGDSGSGDGLGDDSLGGGARGDGRYLASRTHNITERRQSSSSEIWESIRHGEGSHRRTGRCSSGLHSYGTCFCDPTLMTEDGGARASLSRIVMLAETLFEVLDEIQRHPLSLPITTVSLPAPDSVVDSLPVKIHKVKQMSESDIEQCQICLAEYEEGDEIRVLPCQHEYHMSCVNKWLKEVHRVCPLCRGNVCEVEATILSPEIPLA